MVDIKNPGLCRSFSLTGGARLEAVAHAGVERATRPRYGDAERDAVDGHGQPLADVRAALR